MTQVHLGFVLCEFVAVVLLESSKASCQVIVLFNQSLAEFGRERLIILVLVLLSTL